MPGYTPKITTPATATVAVGERTRRASSSDAEKMEKFGGKWGKNGDVHSIVFRKEDETPYCQS